MSNSILVRASRDGDQFHYLWAARRCLQLLSPSSELVAITIEGVSPAEEPSTEEQVEAGEEAIDVAEYHGSTDLSKASLVRYIQLKHSTLRATQPWTPSELENTFSKFAQRYSAVAQLHGTETLAHKLEFWFVSNRRIGIDFLEAVADAANVTSARHPIHQTKLETFTGLQGSALSAFCQLLRVDDNQDGYWGQRNLLFQDVTGYLADADFNAPLQLKDLVARKASSEGANNPAITKIDVLRALDTDEGHLFPAPCLIAQVDDVVPREQEHEIVKQIINAGVDPVVVHAAAGVGKSVLSTRIGSGLPAGSAAILYDCFGNGAYRSASGYRHRHEDALVQIANELAAKSLCHPLIPTSKAKPSDYARAFLARLKQSIASLRAYHNDALLGIIIDAADNAQMAADELCEPHSFVRDLIRQQVPAGVRLVFLCRTHRQELLNPPPQALPLELQPFSRTESALHLRYAFPDATEHDVDEFHALSSRNPRVQAIAVSWHLSLADTLRELGPSPTNVDAAIKNLLDKAMARVLDSVSSLEKNQFRALCTGLAVLRPFVPISVLASVCGIDSSAIRSFAFDLGRALIVTDEAIQFCDEPVETWFRERFRPESANLAGFIDTLKPLATNSAYVAAALPQLMLEAGHVAELVALALSSEGLPTSSPIERRDVEVQRLQFALKATLRAKRYVDAAKLALKAGGESAGNERQRALIQGNTDIAAVLMNSDRIQEIASRTEFGSEWIGSHYAYEAGLMSGKSDLAGESRSKLRMAEEWLRNWSLRPSEERQRERVSTEDIAEMAIAHFNIHGATPCAKFLRRWRPREISFRAGRVLARRLVDNGRYSELDALALSATNDVGLVLAITLELREVQRNPPKSAVKRTLRLVGDKRVHVSGTKSWDSDDLAIRAVTAIVEAGHNLSIRSPKDLALLLTRYLPASPPRGLYRRHDTSRFPLLRAYSLRAALLEQRLETIDLAHDELKEALTQSRGGTRSEQTSDFESNIGALLPWHNLWANTLTGYLSGEAFQAALKDALSASAKESSGYYRERSETSDEIALVWLESLLEAREDNAPSIAALTNWIASLRHPLFTPTLTRLARLCARSGLAALALKYTESTFEITKDVREDAQSKAETYIDLARAILPVSPSDAQTYFDQAVTVASRIGDENLDRWTAILDLADAAGTPNAPAPETAYRLARCAELTCDYVARDKHFDWESTVRAIAGLCPSSSLAILSRWRDRNFGWAERLLPIAIDYFIENHTLDPRNTPALVGFRAQWHMIPLLKNALPALTTRPEKQGALELVYRYMKLEGNSVSTWRALKELATSESIVLDDIDELIASVGAANRQTDLADEASTMELSELKREGPDWDSVFFEVELTTPNDISQAYSRFTSVGPPFHREQFFREACRRVPAGKEPEFAKAIGDIANFDLYDLRTFLEQVPKEWTARLSVKKAIAGALRSFCARYCRDITKSRYYEVLPLKTACELSGLDESDLIDVVLSALGQATELFDARRLFTLIGLLVSKLSKTESSEALLFGLGLFEIALQEADGDGPWSVALLPPTNMDGALAGYIWAALASPKATVRWQAAHVLRAMCQLARQEVVAQVVDLAKGGKGGPFTDSRLHFYDLHGRQWLLIALARAARDSPEAIIPHVAFLRETAIGGEPHVLMRSFASSAVVTLMDSGLLAGDPELRQRLAKINVSPYPPIIARSYERPQNDPRTSDHDEEDLFYFGIDIGPYWFSPLGNCFGKTQAEIERAAIRVIRVKWQLQGKNNWSEDERARRKIFGDHETYHSHSSSPRTDDLQFYLSYHAMMVVAAELLATTPTRRDPDSATDAFTEWFEGYGLSRPDGKWLADRRDPLPLERPNWQRESESDDWPWSLQRSDFDRILMPFTGRMSVEGDWTNSTGSRDERISISSALVSRDRSEALLRALQMADPYSYVLPSAGADSEMDAAGFGLKGWLVDASHGNRLDKYDPWGADIRFPPICPAPLVVDLMGLQSDPERRSWRYSNDRIALWSEVWGQYRERPNDGELENGARLQVSTEFLFELLRKMEKDLIISVEIRRDFRSTTYGRRSHGFDYILPSKRLFLVKSNGSLATI